MHIHMFIYIYVYIYTYIHTYLQIGISYIYIHIIIDLEIVHLKNLISQEYDVTLAMIKLLISDVFKKFLPPVLIV